MLSCHEATERLATLQTLKKNFEDAYSLAETENTEAYWHKAKSLKHDLDRAMKELTTDLGLNYEGQEKELKELFGSNFLGINEIHTAFTLKDGQKLIDLTESQQEEASRLLHEKLNEPDIAAFMEKLHRRELDHKDFMLVLRVGQFANGSNVTMQTLHEQFEPDMQAQGQGKLLFDTDWYKDQPFFKDYDTDLEAKGNMEWVFVTKDVLSETLEKTNDEQTKALKTKEKELNLTTSRRSKAWEVVWDFAVMLRAYNERLFTVPYRYDRTSDVTSVGGPVGVGFGDADGLYVLHWDGADPGIGLRLSR